MQNQNFVWLSFDLGIQGDYEGMYRWLADKKAKECGDGTAYFPYESNGNILQRIQRDIRKHVKLSPGTRIYLIRNTEDGPKGGFVFGGRRQAPWTGYGTIEEQTEDHG